MIKERIREPSTSAGAAAIALAILPLLPPEWQMVAQSLAAAFGGLAVALREKGGAK